MLYCALVMKVPRKTSPYPRELFVCLPTSDARALVHTVIKLMELAMSFEEPHGVYWSQYGNIPRARNALLYDVRTRVGENRDRAWCLWVDSDIYIHDESLPVIREEIIKSWDTGIGWTAHYPMISGDSHLIMTKALPADFTPNVKADKIDKLRDGTKVPMCGFGCLFIPLDLKYEFYTDRWGEDVYYWHDHPDEFVCYRKRIKLSHQKSVFLR